MPDSHKFHMRLPRDGRESLLFILIVSLISVNIIAPLIAMLNSSFSWQTWGGVLGVLPLLWVAIVVCVLLTNKPAQWITNKIIAPTDSFNARIVVGLLINVILMSLIMTIVGTWIGTWHISLNPIERFIYLWPRNFAVAFAVEALIAHPVAHFVMHHYHMRKDGAIGSKFIKAKR